MFKVEDASVNALEPASPEIVDFQVIDLSEGCRMASYRWHFPDGLPALKDGFFTQNHSMSGLVADMTSD
jgi:hypothetical protein